jgi:hypothetical protein
MNAVSIPPVPRLDVDRQDIADRVLKASHIVERQIAWALLHHLAAEFPGVKVVVDDGGERIPCDSPKDAMEAIFAVDEAHIILGKSWVFLVLGNGEDVISDYGVNDAVERAVDAAMVSVGLQ